MACGSRGCPVSHGSPVTAPVQSSGSDGGSLPRVPARRVPWSLVRTSLGLSTSAGSSPATRVDD